MLRSISQLDVAGKIAFLRADFNVPLSDGTITETHRIDSTLPTIEFLLERGARVLVASHLGRPGGAADPRWSLAPVARCLEDRLGRPVPLAPDCVGPAVEQFLAHPRAAGVVLLENLRFHAGEEANDPAFAAALAGLADVYVNDAFGAAHRAHASTAGMAAHFREKGPGLLFRREVDYLSRVLEAPERPVAAMLGGAKVSDKIGILKNLIPRVDLILVGGAMAYTFLAARGIAVGRSLLQEDFLDVAREILDAAAASGVPFLLPIDHVVAEDTGVEEPAVTGDESVPEGRMGLDIGPKTAALFAERLKDAAVTLWNGPLGLFEREPYRHGTVAVAKALAASRSTTVIAGGDTVAAVGLAGTAGAMTHLSTGGGAALEFLEGKTLPGIRALEAGEPA
ncbi:MAG: phosphoglycerate kinase [Deltaproteobacteria bacterium]|nr:phosphoglycerate kinase [Deltaproteobacteria bacterium]